MLENFNEDKRKNSIAQFSDFHTGWSIDKLSNIFEVSLIELLNELISTDGLISNPKIKGDYMQNYNGYVINQLSEKLIDQYEARIAEKDTVIKELRGQVNEFKKERK